MKKIVLIALLSFFSLTAFSQHETLFGRARVVGGFGAPIIEWGLSNDLNTSIGGGGGVIVDNFFIGGYGMGSIDFERAFDGDEIDQLELGHGGFWLGFHVPSHKLIHLYASTRIGWGAVDVQFDNNNQRWSDIDKVFVLTPEIGLELNVTRWFRVSGTVGYRWLNGLRNDQAYTKDDFNGAIAGLTLRFGGFGNYHR